VPDHRGAVLEERWLDGDNNSVGKRAFSTAQMMRKEKARALPTNETRS